MLLRPWAIVQVLHYWQIFPKLVSSFIEEHAPQARFAIIGHTHRPGIWTINDRVLINTGAFGFPVAEIGEVGDLSIPSTPHMKEEMCVANTRARRR